MNKQPLNKEELVEYLLGCRDAAKNINPNDYHIGFSLDEIDILIQSLTEPAEVSNTEAMRGHAIEFLKYYNGNIPTDAHYERAYNAFLEYLTTLKQ